MPRRKKSESPEVTTDENTVPEAEAGPATGSADDGSQPAADAPAFRAVRQTFTSTRAGVIAGEDKRFNAPQAFVDFADDRRATPEEKAELSKAGFRYRPSDKGYSALANAETRQARDDMAVKFTERRLKEKAGQGEGNER